MRRQSTEQADFTRLADIAARPFAYDVNKDLYKAAELNWTALAYVSSFLSFLDAFSFHFVRTVQYLLKYCWTIKNFCRN